MGALKEPSAVEVGAVREGTPTRKNRASGTPQPPLHFLTLAGPGLIVAAAGIGSGDVVSATVGGARFGVVLLWAIVLGAFFKFVLNEGIARWQLATGLTALVSPRKYAISLR